MNNIHQPEAREEVLWERRRTPILLRCVLIPLGLVFIGFPILAAISPDVNFTSTGAAWIGAIGMLFFGFMFLEAAFFRGEIRFDPAARELIFISSGLLIRTRERFSAADATAVGFRVSGGLTKSPKLYLGLRNGQWLLLSHLAYNDADGALRSISEALHVPVMRP